MVVDSVMCSLYSWCFLAAQHVVCGGCSFSAVLSVTQQQQQQQQQLTTLLHPHLN